MEKQEFWIHFNNEMSETERVQIKTLPSINEMPNVAEFPWIIPNLTNSRLPSPIASPSADIRITIHSRSDLAEPANEHLCGREIRNRRGRRIPSVSSVGSDLSYVPNPYQRPNTRAQTVGRAENLQRNEFHRIKSLLLTYAPKLKYQRFQDSRPVPQPIFETNEFNLLNQENETDQENLINQYYIQIKENLALAYESESKASFHHFNVGQNLVKLLERVGRERFRNILTNDLQLSQR